MRQIVSFVVVCALSLGTSFAQEWRTFTSMEDRFSANYPGEPEVTEILWETEYGAMLPGRVYTVEQGANKYAATVVDYNPIVEILTEQGKISLKVSRRPSRHTSLTRSPLSNCRRAARTSAMCPLISSAVAITSALRR